MVMHLSVIYADKLFGYFMIEGENTLAHYSWTITWKCTLALTVILTHVIIDAGFQRAYGEVSLVPCSSFFFIWGHCLCFNNRCILGRLNLGNNETWYIKHGSFCNSQLYYLIAFSSCMLHTVAHSYTIVQHGGHIRGSGMLCYHFKAHQRWDASA